MGPLRGMSENAYTSQSYGLQDFVLDLLPVVGTIDAWQDRNEICRKPMAY